jgi:ribose transport system permease protein
MRRITLNPVLIALLLAVGLFAVGSVLNPDFASAKVATNILRLTALLAIIGAAQTLVILSGGEGIDLSVGAVVTLGAILVFRIVNGQNSMVLPGLLVALLAGLGVGTINGLGIALLRIPPLVMTLGMTGVVQGLILVITQGQMEGAAAPIMQRIVSQPFILGIPGVIFLWVLLGVAMWVLLTRTSYGKFLYAIGANRRAARLSGVQVPGMVILTYALSGLLAALGGFVLLGDSQIVFLGIGAPYTLPSIAAVVVGGTLIAGGAGSYTGTMAGALVLTVLTSLLTSNNLPEAARQVIYGATLLALLSVYGRQRGLRQ